MKNNDIVGVLDALCDLQYVLSGAVLEFGLGDLFDEGFNEVHSSNMSKACNTEQEAKDTAEHYHKHHQVLSYIKKRHGKYFVYRAEDGKTLKSINYRPANLRDVLNVRDSSVSHNQGAEG